MVNTLIRELQTGLGSPDTNEPINSPVDIQDQDLIKLFATDIQSIFRFRDLTQKTKKQPDRKLTISQLKGQGIIRTLTEIYGKSYCEHSGCYAKVKTLAKATRQSEIQVYRQLTKLRKAGIIEKVKRGQPETQYTGKDTYFLTKDFIYTLGIFKKTFYQFGIRHSKHKRVINNSIIKTLNYLVNDTTNAINRRYFKTFNVDYDKSQMYDYDKRKASNILSKLNEIKGKHEQGLTLFILRYNRSITYPVNVKVIQKDNQLKKENNALWVEKQKEKVKVMLNTASKDLKTEVIIPPDIDFVVPVDILKSIQDTQRYLVRALTEVEVRLSLPMEFVLQDTQRAIAKAFENIEQRG